MSGPAYPPRCATCGKELTRATTVCVAFNPCPEHPRGRVTYRLQEDKNGYPAGWPMCAGVGCGKPALDGKTTCGEVACRMSVLSPRTPTPTSARG